MKLFVITCAKYKAIWSNCYIMAFLKYVSCVQTAKTLQLYAIRRQYNALHYTQIENTFPCLKTFTYYRSFHNNFNILVVRCNIFICLKPLYFESCSILIIGTFRNPKKTFTCYQEKMTISSNLIRLTSDTLNI